jgi:ATP adenylyltransferase
MTGNRRIVLEKDTLWQKVLQATKHALSVGAQIPIRTEYEFIEDSGIRFFVRILKSLHMKDEARNRQEEALSTGHAVNPFLPYDKALFVSDVSETHLALLNKYNVVEHHLLIVTRHFEDQDTLLTLQDFEALWACMAEYNGLGFYNGGEAGGASQRHKHLQMVPLPLAPEGPEVPIEPLLASVGMQQGPGTIPGFPFLHVFVYFEDDMVASPHDAARKSFQLYSAMLGHVGLQTPDPDILKIQSKPYCLLITRKWMLLVPRSREFFDSISINSLGFSGALLVRNNEQMSLLKKQGPMNALKNVAFSI